MNNDLSRALKKSKIVSTFSITNKSKIVNQCSVFDIQKLSFVSQN